MMMLAIMTVASIIGRTFFGSSIQGDYEITEMGLAMSVFLFLPECYLRKGHVIVDLFTAHCQPRTLKILDFIGDLVFTLMTLLFAYQMTLSGIEAHEYLELSMLLGLPTWWTYSVGVVCMALCGLCGLLTLYTTLRGGNQ